MTQDNRIPKVVADFAHSQDEQDVLSFLSFKDWFAAQETQNDGWTVVAKSWKDKQDIERSSDFYMFSMLLKITSESLNKVFSTHFCEVNLEEFGRPYVVGSEKQIIDGIEFRVFTISRHFGNYIPDTFELIQEFLLYHNAFYVADKGEYHCITNDGNILPIVRTKREKENQEISVDTDYLRHYLAATQYYLIRYHDIIRTTSKDIRDQVINLQKQLSQYEQKETVILPAIKNSLSIFRVALLGNSWHPNNYGMSNLRGKDIVVPHKQNIVRDKKYVSFIVQRNEHGEEMEATCNENELSNYFVDRGTPHFLTPVFFKKTVLSKYYQEPNRYRTSNSLIGCLDLWGLPIDLTQADLVQIWLGDLGKIPYSEQLHWRQFNVTPHGTITKERFLRDFMAIPTNPSDDPIYDFRTAFEKLQELSKNKHGESLFKTLDDGDQHLYQTLHVPLTEEQKEFDELVIALAKIVTDSLNVSLLSLETGKKISQDKDSKIRGSIDLLGVYLEKIQVDESEREQILRAFRAVQTIRSSGAAHSKNPKEYGKALKKFDLELPNSKKFRKLIVDITQALQYLRASISQS